MISRLTVCNGSSHDPWYNLAVEETLLKRVSSGEIILYLWQNAHTVVIGRNQNAWKECRVSLLEEEGGKVSRRLSGGGAVYHDLGNLNFTFLVRQEEYDVSRQLSVIELACRKAGIPVERSGRNDLLAEGRKFSGNAFYQHEGACYHHGTLMVNVDTGRVGRYLSPSKAKLQAKGVNSVRARVVNLTEYAPALTCDELRRDLIAAFETVYQGKAALLTERDLDAAAVEALRSRNESWEWRFGKNLPMSFSCADKLEWGEVQLSLQVEQGVVQGVQVFSDAMDWSLASAIEQALLGARFTQEALRERLFAAPLEPNVRRDLVALLEEQEI